jgi:UDPglucose 6-dehydrogenase
MNTTNTKGLTIGFIGQGWIGKHYADDFEKRGYSVVRYGLEAPYVSNKEDIKKCEIVFIAVPTPTTEVGFSYEPVIDALGNLADGSTAVIKSTILPGTTTDLRLKFPNLFVMHSPEFLREASAAYDAANPDRNIIGIPEQTPEFTEKAEQVLNVLPKADFHKIMPSLEAEMVKYVGNCFLYSKVLMMNTFHDMVIASGGEWEIVREAMIKDKRIGESHTVPVHRSGHDDADLSEKRGAGGHCFIKDFEAFRRYYETEVGDRFANEMLTSMVSYNNSLLLKSNKDRDILEKVYKKELLDKLANS